MGKKSKRKKAKAKLTSVGGASNDVGGQPQQRTPQPNDDDCGAVAMEEQVQSMMTSDIKFELEIRGISTKAILDRGVLIHALVRARKEGISFLPTASTTQNPSESQKRQQQGLKEKTCSHGFDCFERLQQNEKFFLVAFEENMGNFAHMIANNIGLCAVCESNPTRFWVDIMEGGLLDPRYPERIRVKYRDSDACDSVVACLVFKGTHYLLEAERSHQESHRRTNTLLAGFAAHTAQFIEENSRSKSKDVNMLAFSSREGDLWYIKERETIEFFHKRNVCNCLKEMYDRSITQAKVGECNLKTPTGGGANNDGDGQPWQPSRQPSRSQQQQHGLNRNQKMSHNMNCSHGVGPVLPDGAMCYFCLDYLDETGKPLVRDCSCRGDNAGFAHLSCIIQYAELKSKQAKDRDLSAFVELWKTCPSCKQPYQNQLSMDLSSRFVSFVDVTYGYPGNGESDKMKVMTALRYKIDELISVLRPHAVIEDISNEDLKKYATLKMECEPLIRKLLSMVDEMKKEKKMDRWVHMPHTSLEYQFYELLCCYEAKAYASLGWISGTDTEANMKSAIKYFELARTIYYLLGIEEDAAKMDTNIVIYRASLDKFEGGNGKLTGRVLYDMAKSQYERQVALHGSTTHNSILAGLTYGKSLLHQGAPWCIEGERLIMKMTADSRSIHGPEHKITIHADDLLTESKERFVFVLPDNKGIPDPTPFQALRYDNDGERCIVTGPVTKPRREGQEQIFHVRTDLILPCPGCPVICHDLVTAGTAYGLVNASPLNGKLGAVKSFYRTNKTGVDKSGLSGDGSGVPVIVHFENSSQIPAVVKPENIRIAFDLPSEGPSA